MQGSIASHHVQYRVSSRSRSGAAMVPSIDRAIQSSLADAIEERLAAAVGDDESVVVLREVHHDVVLTGQDCALSGSVVARVSASAASAMVAKATIPSTDGSVVRFPSQTAFIGTFIVEVIAGTAWDRWFFGPLRAYRYATAAETIAAVLADNDAASIILWLQAGGHHEALARILSLPSTRRPVQQHSDFDAGGVPWDSSPLMATAFQLLTAMGWVEGERTTGDVRSQYVATHPSAPNWASTRSLTTWVADFIRFTLALDQRDGSTRAPLNATAADALLAGSLDWLDVPWLRDELREIIGAREAAPAGARALGIDSNEERRSSAWAIERLAEVVLSRGFRWPEGTSHEVLVSRLLAIASTGLPGVTSPEATLVAALNRVVAASLAMADRRMTERRRTSHGPASPSREPNVGDSESGVRLAAETLRDLGPGAEALLRELVRATEPEIESGYATGAAGLFLLTRPVLDVRLAALAREASVSLEQVLAGIACSLFDLPVPFDPATAFWVGSANPHLDVLPPDDPRFMDLQRLLEIVLLDQHLAERDIQRDAGYSPIATLIVRAWARWLPGVHGASVAFLVRNCLKRSGRVRLSASAVDVTLDPAPLDVVLEMAGCFRPIDFVPWLGNRRIDFTVASSASPP